MKMLKFTNIGQENPNKRSIKSRQKDFNEIYDEFITSKAREQSSRCSQCGVPFCQIHCPLQNNIPDWLKLSAEGRMLEAYEISQSTNNMPEICGRICPQDRLCEGNCVIEQSGHGTVTIGSIEKYITDTAWENGWVKPIKVKKEREQSIGIIGAGPAGMACAEELRKLGYKATIYDRYDRPGGLLIYGIPNFKLEKNIVERRTKLLKESGIKFVQNFEIGKDKTLFELKKNHDAILIATGVYKAREIEIPGKNLKNIFPAMQFLTTSNRKGLGDKVDLFDNGTLNAEGKNVVVIGGGDTAMDCVRTAVRQKAKSSIYLFDGAPVYPKIDILLEYCQNKKINLFGVSAKYIDHLKNEKFNAQKYDLRELKIIASTGSPLSEESFEFVYNNLKKDVHLASIAGGTDLVGCLVLGNLLSNVYKGEIQGQSLGIDIDVFNDEGSSTNDKGELVVKKPFPSMPIKFWGDDKGERYHSAYFSKFKNIWHHGDFIEKTANNGFIIRGRSDATLNPGGVRIGTAEIYQQVENIDFITEGLVVGQNFNDDVRIILFVTTKDNQDLDDAKINLIKSKIKKNCSPKHVPSKVIKAPEIPRTKSGKIVELAVRKIINGEELNNKEAIANPKSLDFFKNLSQLKV